VQVHNIRISVKNTGHDFFGRSAVPDSLAIWTHNLNSLDFHQNFTAFDCPSASGQNVGEMGAGVVAGDAYRFFNLHGMDITGGYVESLGIAGGFGQGGGIGYFTTTYGFMVDNAVEFEVVTADGQVRLINECNDAELFWAMRGSGGGTYAILTKFRVQIYFSLPIHRYNFKANFTGDRNTQSQTLREILTAHANNQIEWSAQLVTGPLDYYPEKVSFGVVLPYGDDGSKLKSATADFVHFVNNKTDMIVVENSYASYTTYTDYLSVSAADARATEPAGIFSLLASRLVPRDHFTNSESVDSLAEAVLYGTEKARTLLASTATQVVFETPVSNLDINNMTSALPAWRNALWHVIHVAEWVEPLAPTTLESAANVGSSQAFEPRWRSVSQRGSLRGAGLARDLFWY